MRLRKLPRDPVALEEVGRELLTMEKEQYTREFKVGVIYAKAGQAADSAYLSNGASRRRKVGC